jgi:hypothetical protein
MTLQFERKYLTQGSRAPCHVSFGFFSGFFGKRLAELQIDPQLESAIRPKAEKLHSIWNAILRITFSIWFLHQDNMSWGLLEKTLRLLKDQLEYLPASG